MNILLFTKNCFFDWLFFSHGTFGDWWQRWWWEGWDRVADASFAIGYQKCIRSPTDANNAYQWLANGSR